MTEGSPMRLIILLAAPMAIGNLFQQLYNVVEKTNPYFRLSGEDLKFEKKIATRIVKLGIPLSLQFSLIAVSCMALQKVVMFPVIQLFGNGIVRIFVDEPEVVEMGGRALKITSIFYLFLGTIYVVRGILNGLGDAFFAFLNGIVEVIGRFYGAGNTYRNRSVRTLGYLVVSRNRVVSERIYRMAQISVL